MKTSRIYVWAFGIGLGLIASAALGLIQPVLALPVLTTAVTLRQ